MSLAGLFLVVKTICRKFCIGRTMLLQRTRIWTASVKSLNIYDTAIIAYKEGNADFRSLSLFVLIRLLRAVDLLICRFGPGYCRVLQHDTSVRPVSVLLSWL